MTEDEANARRDSKTMARGAGLAFLGRLGALIEPLSVIIFAKLYGAPTLGLFFLLWGYILFTSNGASFAMTTALQRFVASQKDEDEVHRVLAISFLVSFILSLCFASTIYMLAPVLATFINTDEGVAGDLVTIIRIYVWALPLWTFLEVSTSAVRARRAFGPEVKVRIFYEQGLRMVAGVVFFLMGFTLYGLFISHLLALSVTVFISLQLLRKHYSLKKLITVGISPRVLCSLLNFGAPMAVSNVLKALHSNLPIFVLNFIMPGAAGVTAVAVYTVARKLVSVLQVVLQSFEYVMAPLASAKNAETGPQGLHEMYAFATRLICSIFVPVATVIIILRMDFLAMVGPEFLAAGSVIIILSIGRAIEAATGPAAALIEMLGNHWLPLLNSSTGIGISALLLWQLTPVYGIEGAAVAAAIGLNITAIAGMGEVYLMYRQQPYSKRILRPILFSFTGALAIVILVTFITPWGPLARFVTGISGMFFSFWLLLKWGFDTRDAAAFGRIARWIRH